MTRVSEQELRERLADRLSDEAIDDLINAHTESFLQERPKMEIISELAQKNNENMLLRVSFRLEAEQYDALVNYFGDVGQPGTVLAKRAIEEFIRQIEA